LSLQDVQPETERRRDVGGDVGLPNASSPVSTPASIVGDCHFHGVRTSTATARCVSAWQSAARLDAASCGNEYRDSLPREVVKNAFVDTQTPTHHPADSSSSTSRKRRSGLTVRARSNAAHPASPAPIRR